MLDALLALYLLIYLPARQLWASTRKNKTASKKSRTQGYLETIRDMAVLLLVLLAISLWSGHGATALGFDLPLSSPGKWGLLFAVVLITGLVLFGHLSEKKMSVEKRAEMLAKLKDVQMLPRTIAELRMFCVFAVFVGAGNEILYRGFLIMALTPIAGIVIAVALSAIAYGAAHGYSNPKQFILSIVSAFVFTIAFVLTHSLWWLMLIHTAFAFQFSISSFRMLQLPEPPAAVEC